MIDSLIRFERTNTILYCHLWLETVSFYKVQLQLPVNFENDWFVEFWLTDTACLSIANSARASIQAVQGQGITLTWKVHDPEKVKQLLDDRGVVTTAMRKRWGAHMFYFHDPEGHRIEVWADHGGHEE